LESRIKSVNLGNRIQRLTKEIDSLTAEAAPLLLRVWALNKLLRVPYKEVSSAFLTATSGTYKESLLVQAFGKLKFPEDKLLTLAQRFGIRLIPEEVESKFGRLALIADERFHLSSPGKAQTAYGKYGDAP